LHVSPLSVQLPLGGVPGQPACTDEAELDIDVELEAVVELELVE
jgi:hypothetical protein